MYRKHQKGFTWRAAWDNDLGLIPTHAYWEYDVTEHKTGFKEMPNKKKWSDVFFNGTMMKKCNSKSFFTGVDVLLNDDGWEKSYETAVKDDQTSIGDKKGIVNVRFYCDEYTNEGLKSLEIETNKNLRSKYTPNELYPWEGYDDEREFEKEINPLFIDPTT